MYDVYGIITFNALITHSVRKKLSFKLAVIKIYLDWIAGSTAPVPVGILGVVYSCSEFLGLQTSVYSLSL